MTNSSSNSCNNNSTSSSTVKVSLLDYGAGNVRSVRNAILAAGNQYEIVDITSPDQIDDAKIIIFPGVGSFGSAMTVLNDKKYIEPLCRYLSDHNRPFLGICLGMQTLFESSDEYSEDGVSGSLPGLGIIPGKVIKFDERSMAVPHIGWNGRIIHQRDSPVFQYVDSADTCYFVHSFYAPITDQNKDWVLTSTTYGHQRFISSIQKGSIVATQFHPEKSGQTGLNIIKGFLEAASNGTLNLALEANDYYNNDTIMSLPSTQLTKRLVVALDVRSNDNGDLVVTKGDQYDVRENESENANNNVNHNNSTPTQTTGSATVPNTTKRQVRNLGKPVALASRYYKEGADEIAFLNITSFRSGVIEDMPMLQVLEEASKNIFVPLTVGGGIRTYTDPATNQTWSALEVAARYFRAGADKVSIGSDAVEAAEAYISSGGIKTGESSIELISHVYGAQAVVISIDPKRVYVTSNEDEDACTKHVIVELPSNQRGPNGEMYCWYQCTVKGGREMRNICAVTVSKACEKLGAGEIMLNCIDMDGQCKGYDLALMRAVSDAVTIPVIASSGAGTPQHFVDVFQQTNVHAALAAGMFHRKEVEIEDVKHCMRNYNIPTRITANPQKM